MALVGAGVRLAGNPGRTMGGANFHAVERSGYGRHGALRNLWAGEAGAGTKYGYPNGYRHPYSWCMAPKAGALSAHNQARGTGSASLTIVAGVAAVGSSAGVGSASATGQLVVSGTGSAAGTSTATGSITAALNATGTAAGTSTASGTLVAKGHATGSAAGVGAASATLGAIGHLAGSSSPFTELSPQSLAESVMTAIVESGLSVREVMQVILAANGGRVEDADTGTIRFRDAADTKDRITATVDASGNRTVVTLDTDG